MQTLGRSPLSSLSSLNGESDDGAGAISLAYSIWFTDWGLTFHFMTGQDYSYITLAIVSFTVLLI